MKIIKIWLDMDGCIVDFDSWKAEIAKTHPEVLDDKNGLWSVVKLQDHFYLNLEPMPDMQELWDFLCSLSIPIEILTALPRRSSVPEAEPDKREWVRRHLGPEVAVQVGPYAIDKQTRSQPGHVLIDDNSKNITQWNARGGTGIFHTSAADTIRQIKELIELEGSDD